MAKNTDEETAHAGAPPAVTGMNNDHSIVTLKGGARSPEEEAVLYAYRFLASVDRARLREAVTPFNAMRKTS